MKGSSWLALAAISLVALLLYSFTDYRGGRGGALVREAQFGFVRPNPQTPTHQSPSSRVQELNTQRGEREPRRSVASRADEAQRCLQERRSLWSVQHGRSVADYPVGQRVNYVLAARICWLKLNHHPLITQREATIAGFVIDATTIDYLYAAYASSVMFALREGDPIPALRDVEELSIGVAALAFLVGCPGGYSEATSEDAWKWYEWIGEMYEDDARIRRIIMARYQRIREEEWDSR